MLRESPLQQTGHHPAITNKKLKKKKDKEGLNVDFASRVSNRIIKQTKKAPYCLPTTRRDGEASMGKKRLFEES
jgi:hypothetical protein